jgi:hypothetical protein
VYENLKTMDCVKKPKRRKLLCSKEEMLLMMLQGLSREYKKYRKILEKDNNSMNRCIRKKSSQKKSYAKRKTN